jgi:hypothetical protein
MKKINSTLTILFALLAIFLISCKKDIYDKNLNCDTTISFSNQILPLVENNCTSCHSAGEEGYTLTNHSNISMHADDVLRSMKGIITLMPEGGSLPDSLIQQFECWMKQGKPNN